MKQLPDDIRFGTLCVHEHGHELHTAPHQLPIYATSAFDMGSAEQSADIFTGQAPGHVYSRYANPTMDSVAAKIAAMESHGLDVPSAGLLFSSGMAAISSMAMALLRSGDKILTQGNLYGGTTELFAKVLGRQGIETIFADLRDLEAVEAQLRADARIRLLYFETPANPTLACVDMAALSEIARRHGRTTAVDNTFCTPYFQQPLAFGVDVIVHSTTKYLNGHGNSIAGAVVARDVEWLRGPLWQTMKLAGTNGNAFDAWLLNNGMKTLELRLLRHAANAQRVAEFLAAQPAVAAVNYLGLPDHPDHALARRQMKGFGGMLSFELAGGLAAAQRFLNGLRLCSIVPTLGDVDTLVLHPAGSSHLNVPRELRLQHGIGDGLLRISVGIEPVEDLLADLAGALAGL